MLAAQVVIAREDKVERLAVKKVSGGATIKWSVQLGRYSRPVLCRGLSPRRSRSQLPSSPSITRSAFPRISTSPIRTSRSVFPYWEAAVGTPSGVTSERIFVGPKALDALSEIRSYSTPASLSPQPNGPTLEKLVDFGTFAFFAKPLFLWLPDV